MTRKRSNSFGQKTKPWLMKHGTRSSSFHKPKNVMIYVKPGDPAVIENFLDLLQWITDNATYTNVHTEKWVCDKVDALVKMDMQLIARYPVIANKEKYPPAFFVNTGEEARKKIDNLITLGGDGTVLWASKQFHGMHIPPLITFSLGSLGYLCEFEFDKDELTK